MKFPTPKDGSTPEINSDGYWTIDGVNTGVLAQGLSITNVEIDKNNHLICTLSDKTTIDAGEIAGGNGNGNIIQVEDFSKLPPQGDGNSLYITLDDNTLYYWNNKYEEISSGTNADFQKANITFDGIETTFQLPTNKKVNVYINGILLTEKEDYTIDDNKITFFETWDDTDLCTLIWIKSSEIGEEAGTIDHNLLENRDAPKQHPIKAIEGLEDELDRINIHAYVIEEDIPDPWPSILNIESSKVYNKQIFKSQTVIKNIYIIQNQDNKIVGCGNIISYNDITDQFEIVLTKYGEANIKTASKEDIDELFKDVPPNTSNGFLATKENIDSLFNGG